MKTVTYHGPDDWFRIDEPETITFARDVPEQVSSEVARVLASYEGHDFAEGESSGGLIAETNQPDLGAKDKE